MGSGDDQSRVVTQSGGKRKTAREFNGEEVLGGSMDREFKHEEMEMWEAIIDNGEAEEGREVFVNTTTLTEEEEEDEVAEFFNLGRKKKRAQQDAEESALLVERVMAELEVAAEDDAELNRESKPAVNKLMKLPLVTEFLSKIHYQAMFLDRGILTLLKNWLEPLPDGSMPNITLREGVLNILTNLHMNLENAERREQLKHSGLGRVIMFLSKYDEETVSNKKLARDLVNRWSWPIFGKSARYGDLRNTDDIERQPRKRRAVACVKKAAPTKAGGGQLESRDDLDLDMELALKKCFHDDRIPKGMRVTIPEAVPLDYIIRPESKVPDQNAISAREKRIAIQERQAKINKKLLRLKTSNKKGVQRTRVRV